MERRVCSIYKDLFIQPEFLAPFQPHTGSKGGGLVIYSWNQGVRTEVTCFWICITIGLRIRISTVLHMIKQGNMHFPS